MKTLRVLLMSILFLDGRDLMAQQKEVKSLLQSYYEIKDALVAGDGDSASDRAEEFVRMMGEMPVNQLDAARQKSWKLRSSKILNEADKIGSTRDLARQRDLFGGFSEQFYNLLEVLDLHQDTVYLQYCPMKKAYWMSAEQEIRNPYYGKSMLTCGTVKDSLK